MYKSMDIYFEDLTESAQKRLLDFVGAKSAKDMNWDNPWPIASFDFEEEEVEE